MFPLASTFTELRPAVWFHSTNCNYEVRRQSCNCWLKETRRRVRVPPLARSRLRPLGRFDRVHRVYMALESCRKRSSVRCRSPRFQLLQPSDRRKFGIPAVELRLSTSMEIVLHRSELAGSGGCFPLHYDNPGPPNKRALTCLLYLNPDWKEGDGGEVCLTPFLKKEESIAPILDRLVGVFSRLNVVAFLSGRMH